MWISVKWPKCNMVPIDQEESRRGKYLARSFDKGSGRAQRGAYVMTQSLVLSRSARPNSVNEHFIIIMTS